ncbi:MAG: MGMT family protein [Lachnospiraceae bacterium]|nr:MGMT family protein [Lachnospiraceae bacterium]MDD3615219.1 MGMT family protein [Lachnospiraceae bacterium]
MIEKGKSTYDKIYDIVREIPQGKVASYGQIAELAGNRRWSRVVGYALNVSPEDKGLPCHRVVNRYGEPSKCFETAGENRQIKLLEAEGVRFVDGRVDMEHFQWNRRVF